MANCAKILAKNAILVTDCQEIDWEMFLID